jgi:hypothetical protein
MNTKRDNGWVMWLGALLCLTALPLLLHGAGLPRWTVWSAWGVATAGVLFYCLAPFVLRLAGGVVAAEERVERVMS